MKDLIKKALSEIVKEKTIITERYKSPLQTNCEEAFENLNTVKFCLAATDVFKQNKKKEQEIVRNKLKEYFIANEENISNINLEILKKESKLSVEGFKEFKWVSDNGQRICQTIREKMKNTYNELLEGKYVLFTDKNGDYHLLNRLDTNYSALAIMFTNFLDKENVINVLEARGVRYQTQWLNIVNHLINYYLFPGSYTLESFGNNGILMALDIEKYSLNDIFENEILRETPEIKNKTIEALTKVREMGFATEKEFLKLLDEYGIEYKNFAKDYGFVDRFLGIDLFVKVHDFWMPAQIKTSKQEKTLIDTLGCRGTLNVYKQDGEFFVNYNEFELLFCELYKICNKKNKKEGEM
jgi:hypothetical protein